MSLKMIQEETEVEFKSYADLSYHDVGEPEITLYVKGSPIGFAKVWKDSEEEGREYICINYEVIYLDTINKIERL